MKAQYASIILTIIIGLSACVPPEPTQGSQVTEETTVPAPLPTPIPSEASIPTEVPPPTETSVPTETPFVPKVTLTELQDGQLVPCSNDISGTYSPDLDKEIWPVVFVSGRFYPQDNGGKAAQKLGAAWYQTVRFGNCDSPNPADVGLTFRLIILTADESANAAFEAYFENAKATGEWGGMSELPSGVEQQLIISVVRK